MTIFAGYIHMHNAPMLRSVLVYSFFQSILSPRSLPFLSVYGQFPLAPEQELMNGFFTWVAGLISLWNEDNFVKVKTSKIISSPLTMSQHLSALVPIHFPFFFSQQHSFLAPGSGGGAGFFFGFFFLLHFLLAFLFFIFLQLFFPFDGFFFEGF